MSTKPGATINPEASITRFASDARSRPSAAIRPSFTATSPLNRGLRRPSKTVPPLIMTSNSAMNCPLSQALVGLGQPPVGRGNRVPGLLYGVQDLVYQTGDPIRLIHEPGDPRSTNWSVLGRSQRPCQFHSVRGSPIGRRVGLTPKF